MYGNIGCVPCKPGGTEYSALITTEVGGCFIPRSLMVSKVGTLAP